MCEKAPVGESIGDQILVLDIYDRDLCPIPDAIEDIFRPLTALAGVANWIRLKSVKIG